MSSILGGYNSKKCEMKTKGTCWPCTTQRRCKIKTLLVALWVMLDPVVGVSSSGGFISRNAWFNGAFQSCYKSLLLVRLDLVRFEVNCLG